VRALRSLGEAGESREESGIERETSRLSRGGRPRSRCQLLLAAFTLLAAPLLRAADSPSRPNIVHIVADELGYYEPAFMGGKTIRTPHLDRLAAELAARAGPSARAASSSTS
jgi:hypothetical protein